MRPEKLPAAREVVMRRADDVQVVIEPRAIDDSLFARAFRAEMARS